MRWKLEHMDTKKQPKWMSLKLALIGVVLLSLNGCMMVKSESAILGRYELKGASAETSLLSCLQTSFTEGIAWQGKVQNRLR